MSEHKCHRIGNEQPAAPSEAVNVIGMPEFDGLLDYIYEYGTEAEGVIERASAFARAVIARYAPQQPAMLNGVKAARVLADFAETAPGRLPGRVQEAIATIRAADNRDAAGVDSEEDAYVIERMGKMLAEIAVIVNGPEPDMTRWSYHDLPEKVRALKTAPAAVPAGEAVAYLDIGVGGYLDLGTEKNADELFKLPPGRHMLGIIGTYGVDGYKANPPAAEAPAPVQATPQEWCPFCGGTGGHWEGCRAPVDTTARPSACELGAVPSAETLSSALWRDWMTTEQADALGRDMHGWMQAHAALQHRGDSRGGEDSGGAA